MAWSDAARAAAAEARRIHAVARKDRYALIYSTNSLMPAGVKSNVKEYRTQLARGIREVRNTGAKRAMSMNAHTGPYMVRAAALSTFLRNRLKK